jgi:hypothetical protein
MGLYEKRATQRVAKQPWLAGALGETYWLQEAWASSCRKKALTDCPKESYDSLANNNNSHLHVN